jgi:hypothetical protein
VTPLDLTRPVQTRDGRAVRIYATDAGDQYPVHGAISDGRGGWAFSTWTMGGAYNTSSHSDPLDLIPAPAKFRVERWVNVYEDGSIAFHRAKGDADLGGAGTRLACKRIVIEGVEGDRE